MLLIYEPIRCYVVGRLVLNRREDGSLVDLHIAYIFCNNLLKYHGKVIVNTLTGLP